MYILFIIECWFRKHKIKIYAVLCIIAVLFMIYFYTIDFNYKLLGYYVVNINSENPQNSDNTINENYLWGFQEIIYCDDKYEETIHIDIIKDIEAIIDFDSNETVYFYLVPLVEYGQFTLDYTYDPDDLSDTDIYVEIDQSETTSILSAVIKLQAADFYYVTYVLHQKYNCWVPCYANMSKSYTVDIQIERHYYDLGLLAYGIAIDSFHENPTSEHFYTENYSEEKAMESFAANEGKKIMFDGFSYEFKYKTYVAANGKKYEITKTYNPTFPYLRNSE